MIRAKEELLRALQQALAEVAQEVGVDSAAVPLAVFETPKQASHGDWAVTAAMPLAKAARKNPREVATALVARLQATAAFQRWVAGLEIAGPGFINLRLSPAARQTVVAEVHQAGALFGVVAAGASTSTAGTASVANSSAALPAKVLVEFVSANPTGPLHTGHTRQAALGDAICSLLQTQGVDVTREFYYNDAGVQIATLAASVQARLQGVKPGDAAWPESAYNGDYIADVAADFAARKTVHADDREFTASGDIHDLDSIRQFAVAYLRHEQDLDLQALGVHFDHYFLESSLYTSGRVDSTVQRLVASGKTYEQDGALWLRTTDDGDDKDRVMRKQDGSYTYFVPDVAYHLAKFERGFTQAINIQGGDHHGTIARVRAGVQAASQASGQHIPKGYPNYILHKMVTVLKDGAEVKISKRAGSYVTLRDLVDWTGRDAVRFFMLSRKADTEFVFDVDLARKANDENPVFYVQYAHARIQSVLAQYSGPRNWSAADLTRLLAPTEQALMLKLADYPGMLARAAADLAPHDVAFYLRDLAAAFHSYYAAERFLVEDSALAHARLALLAAIAQVLQNALGVLGVSAPVSMQREERVAA
jgi:arginyl-tRNA synthetase